LGRYRWTICALLFLATTVNYIDRQVLSILKPTLQQSLGWSEIDYGDIVFYFQLAYAIGLLVAGRIIDVLGTKIGYSLVLVIWSLAAMAHAGVRTVTGFATARFMLGLGESGNFPAAIKSVAEWFPRKERALATGIFNSGTNIGIIVASLAVPPLTLAFGWQAAFIATGAVGLLWLALDPNGNARPAPARVRLRARLHPERSRRSGDAAAGAGHPGVPAGVGVRGREVHDRPDLVAVPLLGSGLPLPHVQHQPEDRRPAAHGHLRRPASAASRRWFVADLRLEPNARRPDVDRATSVLPMVFAPQEPVAGGRPHQPGLRRTGAVNSLFTTTWTCSERRGLGGGFGGGRRGPAACSSAKITGLLLEVTRSYLVVFIIAQRSAGGLGFSACSWQARARQDR
jgi:MFS family permease